MQSKLLHSCQTSITASDNLVVCLSITPHSPPLYVGGALHNCMTDYHFTLSSRTFSSNISAPTVVTAWYFLSPAKCQFCYPFWLNLFCNIVIPPPWLSQHFIPTFSLHLVCSLLNVIMFIYPQPLLHHFFTIYQCFDSSSLLSEWSALCVYEEHLDLVRGAKVDKIHPLAIIYK